MDLENFLRRMLDDKNLGRQDTLDDLENQSEVLTEYSNDWLTEIDHNNYVTADMREYVDNKFRKSIRN